MVALRPLVVRAVFPALTRHCAALQGESCMASPECQWMGNTCQEASPTLAFCELDAETGTDSEDRFCCEKFELRCGQVSGQNFHGRALPYCESGLKPGYFLKILDCCKNETLRCGDAENNCMTQEQIWDLGTAAWCCSNFGSRCHLVTVPYCQSSLEPGDFWKTLNCCKNETLRCGDAENNCKTQMAVDNPAAAKCCDQFDSRCGDSKNSCKTENAIDDPAVAKWCCNRFDSRCPPRTRSGEFGSTISISYGSDCAVQQFSINRTTSPTQQNVRCCRPDNVCLTARTPLGTCPSPMSYGDAVQFCVLQGYFLCTIPQYIKQGGLQGRGCPCKGCAFDDEEVWVDGDYGAKIVITLDADCGVPTYDVDIVKSTTKLHVRCCKASGQCTTQDPSFYTGCPPPMSHLEAVQYCLAKGQSLCTPAQYVGCRCTGCQFDSVAVWVDDAQRRE